ncbi:hypothetical protein HYPBUDRAFT_151254 [Hyphopichia burtonii NRRL Y-1933]|uniref:Uncharacterized protein n=1 Tax=Hyphopichia burtonii NRRL Y-1933 TaxID=984485 RepID=A0A1E4RQG6_9ASCO|nr:hypothetical protein HYPBUDRAFT_151254 [Hyphopichia burtonii NRRL Y-1933]ODV69519.1 hypothetical protein HYPBUDRAFT_151254 [Hyphopichia burtonii NRRL Y-1933]
MFERIYTHFQLLKQDQDKQQRYQVSNFQMGQSCKSVNQTCNPNSVPANLQYRAAKLQRRARTPLATNSS